ncbi:MAG TPA: FAD-dependent oxidoreductase [Coriobacteriia bacterium]|nr:FAD-dependent oxidoreductase [Coriobacteriia bacterium]
MSDNASSTPKDYDVVIVGAGPAGLTAGMYAGRMGLSTALVAGSIGGQMLWAHCVENFIGWQPISGADLLEKFREHVSRFAVDCFEGQLVNAVVPAEDGFDIFTREGTSLHARSVIIASGKAPNRLSIPGEQELVGRGVSYCATCDAAFFIGKDVVVIGPGEAAADAALQLAELGAGRITLVNSREITAPEAVLDKIEANERINIIVGRPVSIEGTERVEALVVSTAVGELTVPAAGVFIEVGSISAADFALGLVEVNDKGEIVVDKSGATSTSGIYAAGDVTDEFGKQIITAAGLGARAAMAAARDLKRR